LALLFAAVPASEYAGAEACKGCHLPEYTAQSATAHASALARSKPGQPGDWAFGAGSQAITFVSRVDEANYLEHGESWYAKLRGYARTPGHRASGGVGYRIFDPSAGILRCFSCHSTGPVALDSGNVIQPHEQGVRCEDCHGPAAGHAHDPRRVKPLNPARLGAAGMNELCGACHRMPMATAAAPDLGDPWNARHQPLMLAASACFQRSGSRLSCLTCHAPHTALERTLALYDTACTGCHAAPRHRIPVAGRSCVECHMPAVKLDPALSFSNHRIAIYRPEDPLTPRARR
jgi:hypothetical protein